MTDVHVPTVRPRAVTLQDIARQCGVCKALVSRVLRGDDRNASAATAARIREAARALGYDPARHHAAQHSDVRVLNHVIALFFPIQFYRESYYTEILAGIRDVLRQEKYATLIDDLSEEYDSYELPYIFARGDVDGAIIYDHPDNFAPVLRKMRQEPNFADRPVVWLIDLREETSSVVVDDYHGGYQALAHLLDQGHRQILHMCREGSRHPQLERRRGYWQACRDRGLDPEAILTYLHWEELDHRWSQEHLFETLEGHPGTTAILARTDGIAALMAAMLRRAGWRIPDDISLVGYDDITPVFNRSGENFLTTVRAPLRDVGRCAAEMILRQLTAHTHEVEALTLPTELILRGSTAPPRPGRPV